jgi:SPP1 gp7 family putative phage head morphogenesis protein
MADATNISDTFADEFTSHAVDTLRFTETVRADVLALLRGLEQMLVDKINQADIVGVQRTAFQIARQENLLKQIRDTIKTAYGEVAGTVKSHLIDLSEVSQMRLVKIVNEVFGSDVFSTALTPADLRELVTDAMIQGHASAAWWAKQGQDLQHRFAAQIRMGVANGETNNQLVQRIRGTSTGRSETMTIDGLNSDVPAYVGGIMDASTSEATGLVRTAVQTISNNIHQSVFEDNADVLNGIQWLSVLDGRTTQQCRALSGGTWSFDGSPIKNSPVKIPYPGPPPIHWNCRSTIIPLVKSWSQLAGRRIPGLSDLPEATQASMDGQVAGDLTYEGWLESKPVAFQKDVLGDAKWQLWNSGKLTLSQMIDQSGNPLTIGELRQKAGIAA